MNNEKKEIDTIEQLEITPEEEKNAQTHLKSLPKDFQKYIWKLRKKVTSCNERINKVYKSLNDVEDNMEIVNTSMCEHDLIIECIREFFEEAGFKELEDEIKKKLIEGEFNNNQDKSNISNDEANKDESNLLNWKNFTCMSCFYKSTCTASGRSGVYFKCTHPVSIFFGQEIDATKTCTHYYKYSPSNKYLNFTNNPIKQVKKIMLCIEDIHNNNESEFEIANE